MSQFAKPTTCPRCHGNGASCQVCSGRGCLSCNYEAAKPCPLCNGTGKPKAAYDPVVAYNEKEPRRR